MIGLGYIGLPTAAVIASNKIEVIGVDLSQNVVNTINEGRIHIVEPALDGLVKKVVDEGYLRASDKCEESDVFVVAVPTPFKENNVPDLSYVEGATRSAIPALKEGDLFIIESTSPVGTTEKMAGIIYEERPELRGKLHIAYCPERVMPGKVIYELENNDRVIGGMDEQSAEKAAGFYGIFVSANLHKTTARTAEMCKLTENSFRDVNIAFANELSIIAEKAGIDVWELIQLANKHPRVNILQPGTGVGGHCIAVDPWFIVSEFPEEAKIIHSARKINDHKADWVVERIKNEILEFQLNNNRKPKVALMGLAFKPDIDDLRESPAMYVVNSITQFDKADYLIVEPNLNGETELSYDLVDYTDAYHEADIVAFLVAHREFRTIEKDKNKAELDFCGARKKN
jgi:UDP-N-acetyl-D-mannosaminuronic acid dehydrogenase